MNLDRKVPVLFTVVCLSHLFSAAMVCVCGGGWPQRRRPGQPLTPIFNDTETSFNNDCKVKLMITTRVKASAQLKSGVGAELRRGEDMRCQAFWPSSVAQWAASSRLASACVPTSTAAPRRPRLHKDDRDRYVWSKNQKFVESNYYSKHFIRIHSCGLKQLARN